MRPDGSVRQLVKFPEGINPIAAIARGDAPRGQAAAGLYVTDTTSTNVYFLPAAVLAARYPDTVLVGAEKTAHFWLIRPHATGFAQLRLRGNLEAMSPTWNLEGAEYVA